MLFKNIFLLVCIALFIFAVGCEQNPAAGSPKGEEESTASPPFYERRTYEERIYEKRITASKIVSSADCDTDGGVNIYKPGTVVTAKKGITTTLTDTCLDEKNLYEQYCTSADKGGGTVTINCLGSCESGACTHTFDSTKCKPFGPLSPRVEEDTINIVVVGAGYSTLEEILPFVKDKFASVFFSVEPWSSNHDAFNFYYVDEVAQFNQETFSWTEALPTAEHCQKPNKVIVLMLNSSFRESGSIPSADQTLANIVGSSLISAQYFPAHTDSKGSFQPARLAISPEILIHELGHSIGGLRDEYTEEARGSGAALAGHETLKPNCFSLGVPTTVEQCLAEAPWKDLISVFPESVGCFEGCFYQDKNIYRPTEFGIMLNQGLYAYGFGLAQERSICCEMLQRTGSVGGYCNLFDQEPLDLVGHCYTEK